MEAKENQFYWQAMMAPAAGPLGGREARQCSCVLGVAVSGKFLYLGAAPGRGNTVKRIFGSLGWLLAIKKVTDMKGHGK